MGRKLNVGIVNDFKNKLMKKFPISKIVFFGSRARGDSKRWSDFDLIIVSDKFEGIKSFKRGGAMYDYWNIDYPVDFICLTLSEFEKMKKGVTIVSEALKEGIVI